MICKGSNLAGYVLDEARGSGLWKAHREDGMAVALRLLAGSERVRDRVGAELEGVPPILELEADGDQPFLSCPWLEGRSLAGLLEDGPLAREDAARWLGELADSLAAVHAAGLVHGALEPKRVVVGPERVWLTGVGLARGLRESAYAAPEVVAGEAPDARADVYAFGVLMFRMLTGELPKGLEVPSELVEDLPDGLDEVFRRCFVRAPKRYADAGALCEDFTPVRIALEVAAERAKLVDPGPLVDVHLLGCVDAAAVGSLIPKLSGPQLRQLLDALPQPILLARPEPEADALIEALKEDARMRKVPAGSPLFDTGAEASPEPVAAGPAGKSSLLLSLGCLFLFMSVGLGAFHFAKPLWNPPVPAGEEVPEDITRALEVLREAIDAFHEAHQAWPESFSALREQLEERGRPDLVRGRHGRYSLVLVKQGKVLAIAIESGLPSYRSHPGEPVVEFRGGEE